MWRVAVLVSALTVVPSLAAAQQPCTTDARQVIEQVYRQVLERSADAAASASVDNLNNRTTVREIVRGIAKSPEHLQRFGNQARENVVVDVYRHLLNRGPDDAGMKTAVALVSRRSRLLSSHARRIRGRLLSRCIARCSSDRQMPAPRYGSIA